MTKMSEKVAAGYGHVLIYLVPIILSVYTNMFNTALHKKNKRMNLFEKRLTNGLTLSLNSRRETFHNLALLCLLPFPVSVFDSGVWLVCFIF